LLYDEYYNKNNDKEEVPYIDMMGDFFYRNQELHLVISYSEDDSNQWKTGGKTLDVQK